MRTKGAKSKNGNYISVSQLQRKCAKVVGVLDDLATKSLRNHTFNKLVDFDTIGKLRDQLDQLSKMQIDDQSNSGGDIADAS